jgi:uncharacterized membrane protein
MHQYNEIDIQENQKIIVLPQSEQQHHNIVVLQALDKS